MGQYTKMSYCPRCGNISLPESEIICSYCGEMREITDTDIDEYKSWTKQKIIRWQEDLLEFTLKPISRFNATAYASQKEWLREKFHGTSSTQPRCPSCGSTQIQMVPRRWSWGMGLLTNKVDRVCVNCKRKF